MLVEQSDQTLDRTFAACQPGTGRPSRAPQIDVWGARAAMPATASCFCCPFVTAALAPL